MKAINVTRREFDRITVYATQQQVKPCCCYIGVSETIFLCLWILPKNSFQINNLIPSYPMKSFLLLISWAFFSSSFEVCLIFPHCISSFIFPFIDMISISNTFLISVYKCMLKCFLFVILCAYRYVLVTVLNSVSCRRSLPIGLPVKMKHTQNVGPWFI